MDQSFKTIMWVILFIVFFCAIYDVKKASTYKEEVKNALDIATKAATLQADKDPNKIAQGIFEIDPVASKTTFEQYLSENLSSTKSDLFVYVVEYKAINTHTLTYYTNPVTGAKKPIDHPTFVAVMKFNYKGIFTNKSISIDNLSGTRMVSPGN